jgi:DNA polymerase III psi subunit
MVQTDGKHSSALVREIIRTLVVTMSDVAALKILTVAHLENGSERLDIALHAAEQATKPFLDSLDRIDDEDLLHMLVEWQSGMPR